MTYPWDTEEAKKRREKASARYMLAHTVGRWEAALVVVEPGSCNWCGKPVPRKGQRFCPGVWEEAAPNYPSLGKRRVYHCYNEFFAYWCTIPRFKRVIFVRDRFTCKACGTRPLWTNRHGIVLPDVRQLACDHIIPVARGGKTELSNLQTLCRKCNSEKGDKLGWKPAATVSFEEWLQLWDAEKVARQSGLLVTWHRKPNSKYLKIEMRMADEV